MRPQRNCALGLVTNVTFKSALPHSHMFQLYLNFRLLSSRPRGADKHNSGVGVRGEKRWVSRLIAKADYGRGGG